MIPLHPEEEKWLLVWHLLGDRLETWLHVAFARWPIERTLEDQKSELGYSHFEVRKYQSLMRHLYISMVSHLFLARQRERLGRKKPGHHVKPSPRRRQCLGEHAAV
jgi:SRSO17 transposase